MTQLKMFNPPQLINFPAARFQLQGSIEIFQRLCVFLVFGVEPPANVIGLWILGIGGDRFTGKNQRFCDLPAALSGLRMVKKGVDIFLCTWRAQCPKNPEATQG